MNERQSKILELLTEQRQIEVSTLATLVDISQVTVRKDLDQLESQGLLHREHGSAVINSMDNIGNRLAYHYETKSKIAALAASDIADGETVIIESGSCCALLARELAMANRNITIVTNSAFIATYIGDIAGAKIVLLGGDYQAESQVMVGPITKKCVEEYHASKLFIGADGFDQKFGFTGKDRMRAETVRDMMKQAENTIVLTESEKFDTQGVVRLVKSEGVSITYTDEKISPAIEKLLTDKKVIVRKVQS
jgi:DeoR/GlpR family transcriptional regulator of sugar metabolism